MKKRFRICIFRHELIINYQRISKKSKINRNVKTWRKQIESAITEGQLPEPSVWDNPSDESWVWK